ncbi:MAG: hypothetical protein SGPRY_001108, partial [Prymnesium sp.]
MFAARGIVRRAAAALSVPALAVALIPGDEASPSGVSLLRELPLGVWGACGFPSTPRTSSLQASVMVGNVEVLLCGTCHVNVASAVDVRQLVERSVCSGELAAVAVECDAQTLALISVGSRALGGLPPEEVRVRGVSKLRHALFSSDVIHDFARRAGKTIASEEDVPIPPQIALHLQRDGALWAGEMAEAASSAVAAGVRVVCIGTPARAPAEGIGLFSRLRAGVGVWLRSRALARGFDEL